MSDNKLNKVNQILENLISDQRNNRRKKLVIKNYSHEGNYHSENSNRRNFQNNTTKNRGRQGNNNVGRQSRRNIQRRGKLRFRTERRNNNSRNYDFQNNRRIFISNLHKNITNDALFNIFSRIGSLKRCGVHWDNLGHSKGTADVEFFSPEDAKRAIREYDNANINGFKMKVSFQNGTQSKRIIRKRLGLIRRAKIIIS